MGHLSSIGVVAGPFGLIILGAMTPGWHPLSALLLRDPPTFASAFLIRRLLAKGQSVDVIYAGDRMWPSVRHGQALKIDPAGGLPLEPGSAVVAAPGEVPELLRVDRLDGPEVLLRADADPSPPVSVSSEEILGRVGLPLRRVAPFSRVLRRLRLDIVEALRHGPDASADAAETVQQKYESQAPFYHHGLGKGQMHAGLMERLGLQVAPGGRVLVAGSGAGLEAFALARAGWAPTGVDFSPTMVRMASEEARRRNLDVPFAQADLRGHEEPAGSIDAVLFTYDVYSFVPGRQARVAMLTRMVRWLKSDGVILLSARRCRGLLDRALLTIQWLAGGAAPEGAWGGSHTRWVASDGSVRRSFVKVFADRRLLEEIRSAGLTVVGWEPGHVLLRRSDRSGAH